MSQRYVNETLSTDNETISEQNNYPAIIFNKQNMDKKVNNDLFKPEYQSTYNTYNRNIINSSRYSSYGDMESVFATHTIPRGRNKTLEDKYRSPNICIAKGRLGGPVDCKCNRHFTLNVPNLRNSEVTTSL